MRARELGAAPVTPAMGATLRMLAAACGARTVIEIGTGAGVSGLWLLEGMTADGVLTSIDLEAEFIEAARYALREAGIPSSRARLINGRALDVMPRMRAAGYDMVVIDADIRQLPSYLSHARRVVRPGGVIAVCHSLLDDRVSDPARREEATVTMRHCITEMSDDPELVTATLTCGDGITVAITCS